MSASHDRLYISAGMATERSGKKKSRCRNNNIKSMAKLIRPDLSSIKMLPCFISSLFKRGRVVSRPLWSPSQAALPSMRKKKKKESQENRNGTVHTQSHYTLVSLKGQHISLVPTAFASYSTQVVIRSQHSCFHSRLKETNYIEIFCLFYM